MPRLSISYRRSDSEAITGRIFDRLIRHYGRKSVFRDVDNVPVGVDFRSHIQDVLQQSDVLLAVVGPNWRSRPRSRKASRSFRSWSGAAKFRRRRSCPTALSSFPTGTRFASIPARISTITSIA
jgi:hypothetical protein